MWFGKIERILLIIFVPLGLFFLGLYNYLRDGVFYSIDSFFNVILDLFYKQGVSFAWFCSGLGVYESLPQNTVSYTFGGFIDYLHYGVIGQILWGNNGLGVGNNLMRGEMGNSMAHHLSYLLLGDAYLQGHGCGSSGFLEVFVDYGYIGIIIYCVLLGIFCVRAFNFSQYNLIKLSLVLLTIDGILYMPRAQAMQPFLFVLQLQFICPFIICFGYALLISSGIVHLWKNNASDVHGVKLS